MTEERTTKSSDPVPQAGQTAPEIGTQRARSSIWLVILYGLVAIAFTAGWLWVYDWLNTVIWSNDFVTSHAWTIPLGVVFFSLLVGLAQKYLRAPTVIGGGFTELMREGSHTKENPRLLQERSSRPFARCSREQALGLKDPWRSSLHCLSRNLTARSSRNTHSGIIVEFSTIPPLHQFSFTEKTGYRYNAFHESNSC